LRPLKALLLCAGLLGTCAAVGAAIRVTDDSGRTLDLTEPASRIVSLSPHAGELVVAAGAGAALIGATAHSDYPAQAARVPRIGDAARIDRERLLTLRPDLVIAWPSGNRPQDLAWLERAGIPVYHSDPPSLEKIAENLREIGRLAGTVEAAEQAADAFDRRLSQLRNHYSRPAPIPVFFQVWAQPLITIGGRHIIAEALAACGARSVFPDLAPLAPSVSREAVIAADPHAIVAAVEADASDDPFTQWRRWEQMRAVADDRLITVLADLVHRPTPRLLDGIEIICRGLDRDGRKD